jgi:hypothetical protein
MTTTTMPLCLEHLPGLISLDELRLVVGAVCKARTAWSSCGDDDDVGVAVVVVVGVVVGDVVTVVGVVVVTVVGVVVVGVVVVVVDENNCLYCLPV